MDILIYGGGLLGRQLHHLVSTHLRDRFTVLGFVDDDPDKRQSEVVTGLFNLGSLDEVSDDDPYAPEKVRLVMAIGYADMKARYNAFRRAKARGYVFESLIHPEAHVDRNVTVGEGNVILAGAVVDQYVRMSDAVYLDIGALIGEQSVIRANNYFAAGTTIGGSVTVGEHNFFGLNSTVVNDVSIGSNNFINAQTLIYKNLGDDQQVVELHEQRIVARSP